MEHAPGCSVREPLGELPPLAKLDDFVAAKLRTGGPYSGRLAVGARPLLTFQLDYPDQTQLYAGLGEADLRGYVEALRRCLALLGTQAGDALALLDYGSSPIVYLMSASCTPHLHEGAGDALGCTVVCRA